MKIKGNKKIENNDQNSFNIKYQKIKEEIKSVVITKLLNQIENLYKKYELLKKENSLIKNDLIYILKRVLINKNEYININNNNNTSKLNKNYQTKSSYTINGLKNKAYLNSKSYNSFLSSKDNLNNETSNYNQLYYNYYNRETNTSMRKQMEKRRYSIDDDCKKGNNSSFFPQENSLQFNMQNKIDYYLNSLYKHNFSEECATGTSSVHLLNKNQSIYDELFSNKNNRNKNLSHLNTDFNFRKISNRKERKNINSNNDNFNYDSDSNKKNNKYNNMQKNQTNNYLKVHRKGNISNISNITNTKSKNKISGYNKIKNSGSKSSGNMMSSSNSKHYSSSNKHSRSKFLVNKF